MRKKIVVLGGGTAGWITALMVHTRFPNEDITVIASEEIGILGAGEGTVFNILIFLDQANINILDVFKECKATVKYGILFKDWAGEGSAYFHAFSHNIHHTAEQLCLNKKVPYGVPPPNLLRPFNPMFALHFDARLFATFLKKIAISRGIKHIDKKVVKVENGNNDEVKKLHFDDKETIELDFIFDCSGFRREILGKHYKVKWKSYSDVLGVNAAIPFFKPIDADESFISGTEAIAMKNGWVWKIPVVDRYGMGYVYDTNYATKEDIIHEIQESFGVDLPSDSREFKFDPGTHKKILIKNCFACGLAHHFVEPLEATNIAKTIAYLDVFLGLLKGNIENYKADRIVNWLNKHIMLDQKELKDFIHAHYLTSRADTPFWKEYKIKHPENSYIKKIRKILKNFSVDQMTPLQLAIAKNIPSHTGGWELSSWEIILKGSVGSKKLYSGTPDPSLPFYFTNKDFMHYIQGLREN